MSETLTNVAITDAYANATTLGPALDIQQLVFQIFNEPVYARFFKPQVGDDNRAQPTLDPTEHYFPVGTLLSVDGAAGVQFRNAIPGQAATVNAEIAFVGDPIFDFQSSGLFSAAVLTLSFLHNNALVGAEGTLDFEDSAQIVWTVTDTPGTKEAVSAAFVAGSVVTSVFGRTGAVVAVSGDYTAAQVTNAADKSAAAAQVFTGALGGGSASAAIGAAAGFLLAPAGILSLSNGAASNVFTSTVSGDVTGFRFSINTSGAHSWGPGNAAIDVTLTRSSVGNLTLGGNLGGLFAGNSLVSGMGGDGGSPLYNAIGAAAGAALNAGGVLQVSRAVGNSILTVTNPGATTDWRFQMDAAGTMKWAAANTASDVTLSRTAAGVLTVTGKLTTTGDAAVLLTPANPTGTSSTTATMQGLSSGTTTITPTGTRVFIIVSGNLNQTTAAFATIALRTGTGNGPANGAAVTGTVRGATPTFGASSATQTAFVVQAVVTGLTAGTAIWVDVSLASTAGGSLIALQNITISAFDLV